MWLEIRKIWLYKNISSQFIYYILLILTIARISLFLIWLHIVYLLWINMLTKIMHISGRIDPGSCIGHVDKWHRLLGVAHPYSTRAISLYMIGWLWVKKSSRSHYRSCLDRSPHRQPLKLFMSTSQYISNKGWWGVQFPKWLICSYAGNSWKPAEEMKNAWYLFFFCFFKLLTIFSSFLDNQTKPGTHWQCKWQESSGIYSFSTSANERWRRTLCVGQEQCVFYSNVVNVVMLWPLLEACWWRLLSSRAYWFRGWGQQHHHQTEVLRVRHEL